MKFILKLKDIFAISKTGFKCQGHIFKFKGLINRFLNFVVFTLFCGL